MGTDAQIIVIGGDGSLPERAEARLRRLESRWSRFLESSELSRLNKLSGTPVVLSAETYDLVSRAVDAWRLTGGLFDPTIHDALVTAGYDRTFRAVESSDVAAPEPVPAPGCGDIQLLPAIRAVTLPPGVHLDLGGIGKGHAADLVVRELMAWGAAGACVNLGGDIRVMGEGPDGPGWTIALGGDEIAGVVLPDLRLGEGAVVTSTPKTRTWQRGERRHHHLIDPSTGTSAETGIAAVTVVANEASLAEVLAKAAYLAGPDEAIELLATASVTGIIVNDNGDVQYGPGLERFIG